LRPLGSIETIQEIASNGVTFVFGGIDAANDKRPEHGRAFPQMGTICGYKAVVLAADTSPRIFPMLTTAAGTITPCRVFVIGAGVAGLQAIATARRLGAVASAYDLRLPQKSKCRASADGLSSFPSKPRCRRCARVRSGAR